MYKDNPNRGHISDYITKHSPDVAWIPEIRVVEAHKLLDNLEMEYPYFYPDRSKIRSQGSILISKYPLEIKKTIFADAENYGPVLHAIINKDSQMTDIFAVHFRSPRSTEQTKTRNSHIRKTINYYKNFGKNTRYVIMGDMNSTFWHPEIKFLRYEMGLSIFNNFFNLNPTWSSHYFEMFKVPIDNIMISKKLCFKNVERLEAFGSDHHGLLAIIGNRDK